MQCNQSRAEHRSSERRIRHPSLGYLALEGVFWGWGEVLRVRCCGLNWWKSDTDSSWALLPSHGRDPQKNSTRSSTGACIAVMLSPLAAAVVCSCKTTQAKPSSESCSRQCFLTQEALLECLWKAPGAIRQWQQFLLPSCRCAAKMWWTWPVLVPFPVKAPCQRQNGSPWWNSCNATPVTTQEYFTWCL